MRKPLLICIRQRKKKIFASLLEADNENSVSSSLLVAICNSLAVSYINLRISESEFYTGMYSSSIMKYFFVRVGVILFVPSEK